MPQNWRWESDSGAWDKGEWEYAFNFTSAPKKEKKEEKDTHTKDVKDASGGAGGGEA
jgi:hypothetical protein